MPLSGDLQGRTLNRRKPMHRRKVRASARLRMKEFGSSTALARACRTCCDPWGDLNHSNFRIEHFADVNACMFLCLFVVARVGALRSQPAPRGLLSLLGSVCMCTNRVGDIGHRSLSIASDRTSFVFCLASVLPQSGLILSYQCVTSSCITRTSR